ncbi:MAG: class I SAM-dependent methyltransferase [Steroidobacteraceae bacterium]|nr:class I SAM-dependent methyltransferase [Steroidobacteraceae bacterium]
MSETERSQLASSIAQQFERQIASGTRFKFGANWARFLESLTPGQIETARDSLVRMLGVPSLEGKTFLDIGSGSGLFSLAARQLGAEVHSFDYDPQSVACTTELRSRYFAADRLWKIERGSVLDEGYVSGLGRFDVVYSWGVLHHTGNMWKALANVAPLVKEGGRLYIAIYNDQGRTSRLWTKIKQLYNKAPRILKPLIAGACAIRLLGPTVVRNILALRPLRSWFGDTERGMRVWTDIVDWVGGYPFEVAKPEEIFTFFRDRGFELTELKTCAGGRGCCEYVFRRR